MQRNAFYGHQKIILLSMITDEKLGVRQKAQNFILQAKKTTNTQAVAEIVYPGPKKREKPKK